MRSELAHGMRRELARNIAIAPIVLLIRLPLALVAISLCRVFEALESLCRDYLPGWQLDYYHAWRRALKETNQ